MTDKQAGTVVHAAAQVVLPGAVPWYIVAIPVHFSVAVGEWRTDEYDEGFTVEIEHPFQSILEYLDQGAAFEGQDLDTYRLSNSYSYGDLSYSYAESWVTWNFGFSQESKPNGQTWSATWEWPQLTDELHDPYLLLFPQTVTLDVDSVGDTLFNVNLTYDVPNIDGAGFGLPWCDFEAEVREYGEDDYVPYGEDIVVNNFFSYSYGTCHGVIVNDLVLGRRTTSGGDER